jgi:hypothetical protein
LGDEGEGDDQHNAQRRGELKQGFRDGFGVDMQSSQGEKLNLFLT